MLRRTLAKRSPPVKTGAPSAPVAIAALVVFIVFIVAAGLTVSIVGLDALQVDPDPSASAPAPTVGGVALETVVARLETVIPEAMQRKGVPGVSVALIGDGQLLWAKGYGLADVAAGEAVTAKTVFLGASFSKTMTAYLALKLVESGVLELDRPLIDYTNEAYLSDSRIEAVTLRMVLSHTSGFTDLTHDRGAICFTPGLHWSYSSDAYRYLQWVIERVTGQPFDQYAADHLFTPLGMSATSFLWREELEPLTAHGYEAEGPVAQWRPTRVNAAYGARTTPSDYACLVVAILNPVEGDPVRLTPATVTAMLTPQSEAAEGVSWGLGWGLEDSADGEATDGEIAAHYCWHWGWLDGCRNLIVFDPIRRAGVVVMANGAGGLQVAEDIVRVVLPGEHPIFPSMIDSWE